MSFPRADDPRNSREIGLDSDISPAVAKQRGHRLAHIVADLDDQPSAGLEHSARLRNEAAVDLVAALESAPGELRLELSDASLDLVEFAAGDVRRVRDHEIKGAEKSSLKGQSTLSGIPRFFLFARLRVRMTRRRAW